MEQYRKKIREILREVNPYEDFEDDTNLNETGVLSSLTLMYLVTELEEIYEIVIKEEDMIPEKFSSVNEVAKLIETEMNRG